MVSLYKHNLGRVMAKLLVPDLFNNWYVIQPLVPISKCRQIESSWFNIWMKTKIVSSTQNLGQQTLESMTKSCTFTNLAMLAESLNPDFFFGFQSCAIHCWRVLQNALIDWNDACLVVKHSILFMTFNFGTFYNPSDL